jgi:hypothetical protein
MRALTRIRTVREFKAAVARGFRAQQYGCPTPVWSSVKRVTFPTGARGIVGEGTVGRQRFLATCRLTPEGGHHLTVQMLTA